MADQFRDQVNTARRAGYSDAEIAGFLKNTDPRVDEALKFGYSPEEIVEHLAPKLTTGEEAVRKTGVAVRGLNEALVGPTAGATAGFMLGGPVGAGVGALAGGLAVPAADVVVGGYNRLTDSNVRLPSRVISEMLPGPRAETPVERVLQSTTGALGSTTGAVGAGRGIVQAANTAPGLPSSVAPGLQAIGREAASRPVAQIATAPVATAVGQTVTEVTDNPFLGLAAGALTSTAAGVRPTKRETVDADALLAKSKANYELLDNSGLQFDTKQFATHMGSLTSKLRKDLGYVESVNPKVAGAFKELTSDAPKDVAEITALRKIIGSAAGSSDASERKIAMSLLDEFDDYVMNAPSTAIVGGDKSAIDAWKTARADYAKVKKAELIEDIIARAEVSQGGKESTIAQGLSSLAKDKKKMRFFTPDEQKAIRNAADGGKLQTMLRTVGKFTPLTPAAAIFTAVNPYGAYTAAAGFTARELATARRSQQVQQLANRMLVGREPKVLEGSFENTPVFFSRGMQNMMNPQQQNLMSPRRDNQNALVR